MKNTFRSIDTERKQNNANKTCLRQEVICIHPFYCLTLTTSAACSAFSLEIMYEAGQIFAGIWDRKLARWFLTNHWAAFAC